jgi:hypothetical protein
MSHYCLICPRVWNTELYFLNKCSFFIYKIHADHKGTYYKLQKGKVQGKVETKELKEKKVPIPVESI